MNDVIHPLSTPNKTMKNKQIVIFLVPLIFAGIITGFLLSKATKQPTVATEQKQTENQNNNVKSAGVKDKKNFKDNAQGILKKGGIEGESEYHLERPGGESQNVYLTSTTVDLSEFKDKKVEVWGQTLYSEKAGWFMDVGAIEAK
ncbi:MAG TPA: hypothetical protein VK338_02725 [Candidatus Nitrosocosmicus sp.]|nr:hypothetical protein [Candidatus Nitrosocosmicus sp.]